MPEVNVEINGRRYRMACEEGQQQHLIGLAERFNGQVENLRGVVGEIGDGRLTVMAGIAVLDDLFESEKRISELENSVAELTRAGEAMANDLERLEERFAAKIGEAARKLEAVATAIDETATQQPQ